MFREEQTMGKTFNMISKIANRGVLTAVGAMFALSVTLGGVMALVPVNGIASAATNCPQDKTPQYNIIYCGLSGTGNDTAQYITSLRTYYDNNNDGHGNKDIQTVMNWAGASPSMIAAMSTNNTVLGTAYSNGTITVNGVVVGTNSIVSARWNPGGPGFTHLEGNVWYRNATTSFAPTSQVEVLVHLNSNGQADFAVMLECGNVMKFHPMPPKQILTCDSLTDTEVGDTLAYTFTAKASEQNEPITSYTFDFSDGSSTGKIAASTTSHTFALYNHVYTANVDINGSVTAPACAVTLTTPKAPVTPALSCVSLTATPEVGSTTNYVLTAQATASNTNIISYVFDFGDKSQTDTVNTNLTSASASHTYAAGTWTASVTVTGKDVPDTIPTSTSCEATVTIPGTPTTPPTTTLVNTGPGSIVGLVGVATVIGGLFHQFVLRRKLSA
jgi:hypothetical protein